MDIIEFLKEKRLDYLLYFYNDLSEDEKTSLLNDIKEIDFDYMKSLANSKVTFDKNEVIEPLKGVKKEDFTSPEIEKISKIGKEVISSGKYAIVTLAGRTRYKTWT